MVTKPFLKKSENNQGFVHFYCWPDEHEIDIHVMRSGEQAERETS